jgi:acetate kinase
MSDAILVLNAGSSSLKFPVFPIGRRTFRVHVIPTKEELMIANNTRRLLDLKGANG